MSHSGLNKFKVHTESRMIEAKYTGVKPVYKATYTFKPILNNQCTVLLLNIDSGEELLLALPISKNSVHSKLESLFKSIIVELRDQKEELDIIRQRRIKRYENYMKRRN